MSKFLGTLTGAAARGGNVDQRTDEERTRAELEALGVDPDLMKQLGVQ